MVVGLWYFGGGGGGGGLRTFQKIRYVECCRSAVHKQACPCLLHPCHTQKPLLGTYNYNYISTCNLLRGLRGLISTVLMRVNKYTELSSMDPQ